MSVMIILNRDLDEFFTVIIGPAALTRSRSLLYRKGVFACLADGHLSEAQRLAVSGFDAVPGNRRVIAIAYPDVLRGSALQRQPEGERFHSLMTVYRLGYLQCGVAFQYSRLRFITVDKFRCLIRFCMQLSLLVICHGDGDCLRINILIGVGPAVRSILIRLLHCKPVCPRLFEGHIAEADGLALSSLNLSCGLRRAAALRDGGSSLRIVSRRRQTESVILCRVMSGHLLGHLQRGIAAQSHGFRFIAVSDGRVVAGNLSFQCAGSVIRYFNRNGFFPVIIGPAALARSRSLLYRKGIDTDLCEGHITETDGLTAPGCETAALCCRGIASGCNDCALRVVVGRCQSEGERAQSITSGHILGHLQRGIAAQGHRLRGVTVNDGRVVAGHLSFQCAGSVIRYFNRNGFFPVIIGPAALARSRSLLYRKGIDTDLCEGHITETDGLTAPGCETAALCCRGIASGCNDCALRVVVGRCQSEGERAQSITSGHILGHLQRGIAAQGHRLRGVTVNDGRIVGILPVRHGGSLQLPFAVIGDDNGNRMTGLVIAPSGIRGGIRVSFPDIEYICSRLRECHVAEADGFTAFRCEAAALCCRGIAAVCDDGALRVIGSRCQPEGEGLLRVPAGHLLGHLQRGVAAQCHRLRFISVGKDRIVIGHRRSQLTVGILCHGHRNGLRVFFSVRVGPSLRNVVIGLSDHKFICTCPCKRHIAELHIITRAVCDAASGDCRISVLRDGCSLRVVLCRHQAELERFGSVSALDLLGHAERLVPGQSNRPEDIRNRQRTLSVVFDIS